MNCITTCVTADLYQYYIPTFVYSARKAMPGVAIKIFVQGKLDGTLRSIGGADIVELDHDYPPCPSILRYLVGDFHFQDYDMVYFTDIDFVFLDHGDKDLFDYHKIIIAKNNTSYAGHRGPVRAKKYKWKTWEGKRTRIAGGAFMATRRWLFETRLMRTKTLEGVKKHGIRYREEDEVLLYNICAKSGLPTPELVGHFICGNKYNITYRDLHLGDFKFDKRWVNLPRMEKDFLTEENARKFRDLEKDSGWRHACAVAEKDPIVSLTLERARAYVRRYN